MRRRHRPPKNKIVERRSGYRINYVTRRKREKNQNKKKGKGRKSISSSSFMGSIYM